MTQTLPAPITVDPTAKFATTEEVFAPVTVKKSPLHGLGLFAVEHIAKDTHIGNYVGPRVKKDGDYVLWISDDDDNHIYGVDGRNMLRYVNHAPNANAAFYDVELYATRDIKPGEEITHHYGEDWDELPSEDDDQ